MIRALTSKSQSNRDYAEIINMTATTEVKYTFPNETLQLIKNRNRIDSEVDHQKDSHGKVVVNIFNMMDPNMHNAIHSNRFQEEQTLWSSDVKPEFYKKHQEKVYTLNHQPSNQITHTMEDQVNFPLASEEYLEVEPKWKENGNRKMNLLNPDSFRKKQRSYQPKWINNKPKWAKNKKKLIRVQSDGKVKKEDLWYLWSLTHPQEDEIKDTKENQMDILTSLHKEFKNQQQMKEHRKEIYKKSSLAQQKLSKTNIKRGYQKISKKKKNHKKKKIHKSKKSNHGHKKEKYVWKTIHY